MSTENKQSTEKPAIDGHVGLATGFPTHTVDITGERICLGDTVAYDFDDEKNTRFVVVFENNAFRKKYPKWESYVEKPLLEYGLAAKKMRLKIVKKACS